MTPLVSVVVPHHLPENDEYLRWCLKSIVSSKNIDLEIICISDSVNGNPHHLNPGGVEFIWNQDLNNVTKKWHHGLQIANRKSKYVMLISDDVMVTENTISEMVSTISDHKFILSPASNCDSTTRFHTQYYVQKPYADSADSYVNIPLKCTLEHIKGFEEAVIKMPLERRTLIDPGWVSFFCTLFPKTVLNQVGDFDEKLDVRYNDVDYCQRARTMGIPSLIHLGCFALHFGDRTLPKCTTKEEYEAADRAYQEKYAPKPKKRDDRYKTVEGDIPIYHWSCPNDEGDLL